VGLGCGASTLAQPAERGACPRFEGPTILGTVAAPELGEISGVVASRTTPGVLYVHNDSGEPHARFFAIRTDGALLAEYGLGEEPALDVEDIAVGPGARPGTMAVYLADVGDNAARELQSGGDPERWRPRSTIAVLRVPEPTPPREPEAAPVRATLAGHERFELRYPAEPYDCEALLVDPASGDLYLLAKVARGPQPVFRARAPLSAGTTTTLERVGEILPARDLGDAITAVGVDARGERVVVRTYRSALLFERAPTQSWLEALAAPPFVLPRLREPQGEAIAWLDARTIVSITEGERAPVQVVVDACGPSAGSR
jgi:hypothetical protein